MTNQISLNMSKADVDAVNTAISILEEKLTPHLKALSDKDRSNLNKLGDKTQVFVEKAFSYATGQFNKQLSGMVDTDEFGRDMDAFKLLGGLNLRLAHVARMLEDSTMISGSEALDAALVTYAGIQVAIKNNVPGAQEAHNELSTRYKKKKSAPVVKPS